MPPISSALIPSAFAMERDDVEIRRRNAHAIAMLATAAPQLQMIREIPGSNPGYLRFPVLDRSGVRTPVPALGIVRPYPRAVIDQQEILPVLHDGEPDAPGARELARNLFGLPVHHFVTARDRRRLANWLGTVNVIRANARQ